MSYQDAEGPVSRSGTEPIHLVAVVSENGKRVTISSPDDQSSAQEWIRSDCAIPAEEQR